MICCSTQTRSQARVTRQPGGQLAFQAKGPADLAALLRGTRVNTESDREANLTGKQSSGPQRDGRQ